MDDIVERKARLRALKQWLNSQEINITDSAILALDLLALAVVQMADNRAAAVMGAEAAAKDLLKEIPRLWDARV